MRKRNKKSQHEEHIPEAWLLPYADLLTLLLALFVVLFAMSSIDVQKFTQMSKAFSKVLDGGTGVFEYPSQLPDGTIIDSKPEDKESKEKEKLNNQTEREELMAIQQKVNAYINENSLNAKLQTSLTDEGLLLTIRDNVLFDSGIADVREKDKYIAKEIADLLIMDPPRNIIVSGHTDNVPIRNANFESNWELSVMRAVNFMKLLQMNHQLNPEWFSAKGFGEFKPVASNDTEAGKAKNRRVEILIMPRSSLIGESKTNEE